MPVAGFIYLFAAGFSFLFRDIVMKILVFLLIVIVVMVFYIRYLEKKAVFYPYNDITAVPSDVGLEYEDIYFKTEDGVKLNGWLVKASENAPVAVFFSWECREY